MFVRCSQMFILILDMFGGMLFEVLEGYKGEFRLFYSLQHEEDVMRAVVAGTRPMVSFCCFALLFCKAFKWSHTKQFTTC